MPILNREQRFTSAHQHCFLRERQMQPTSASASKDAIIVRRFLRTLVIALLLGAVALDSPKSGAAQVTAFSDFGPGNTYGNFGQTIGGQFINGYKFTSAAAGQLSEVDSGIGGAGTFDLTLYNDNAGVLGTSIW